MFKYEEDETPVSAVIDLIILNDDKVLIRVPRSKISNRVHFDVKKEYKRVRYSDQEKSTKRVQNIELKTSK